MNILLIFKNFLNSFFKKLQNNKNILLILAGAFFVRFFGKWPGFQDHPDESAVVAPVLK